MIIVLANDHQDLKNDSQRVVTWESPVCDFTVSRYHNISKFASESSHAFSRTVAVPMTAESCSRSRWCRLRCGRGKRQRFGMHRSVAPLRSHVGREEVGVCAHRRRVGVHASEGPSPQRGAQLHPIHLWQKRIAGQPSKALGKLWRSTVARGQVYGIGSALSPATRPRAAQPDQRSGRLVRRRHLPPHAHAAV